MSSTSRGVKNSLEMIRYPWKVSHRLVPQAEYLLGPKKQDLIIRLMARPVINVSKWYINEIIAEYYSDGNM
jgi:hypothetical protein